MDSNECNSEKGRISVLLFAGVREAMGKECIAISCPVDVTAGQLKTAMMEQYPEIAGLVKQSRIAIGHAFVGDDDRLDSEGDTGTTIALIPPVSGG